MSVELTDDDLREICARAMHKVIGAAQLYAKLLVELRQKVPALSSETIATVKKAVQSRTYQDDGSNVTRTAFCCAWHELAGERCTECLTLLARGRADAEVMSKLYGATPELFSSLAAITAYLNGGEQPANFFVATLQAAYDELLSDGKRPSERALADRSGLARSTVRTYKRDLKQKKSID